MKKLAGLREFHRLVFYNLVFFFLFISFHLFSILALYGLGNIGASGYYCSVRSKARKERSIIHQRWQRKREKNPSAAERRRGDTLEVFYVFV